MELQIEKGVPIPPNRKMSKATQDILLMAARMSPGDSVKTENYQQGAKVLRAFRKLSYLGFSGVMARELDGSYRVWLTRKDNEPTEASSQSEA